MVICGNNGTGRKTVFLSVQNILTAEMISRALVAGVCGVLCGEWDMV